MAERQENKKNNKENKLLSKEGSEKQTEDVDKFTADLAKRINKINKPKRKGIRRFLSVNPFVLIITSVLFFFFLVSIFGRSIVFDNSNLTELMQGINENRFSQIRVQNDENIIAREKSFLVSTDSLSETDITSANENIYVISREDNIQSTSLSVIQEKLTSRDLVTQIRAIVSNDTDFINQIVYGEDYVLAITGTDSQNYILEGVTKSEFTTFLEDNGINLSNLGITEIDLSIFAREASTESILDRAEDGQITNFINLGDVQIAEIAPEFVQEVRVTWNNNVASFPEYLQGEGFSLANGVESFEVLTVTVPAGITFDVILNIIIIGAFIFLGFVIFRSAQASGMGIMQFGQSKAKMFFGKKTDVSFKDVAGIDEAREELNEIVQFLKEPNKFRKLGARIPKGILMFGPPGTGKTLLARAIAGEAGVPFFHTSGSEFEEMLVGAGASRVRDLFAKAKKAAPALIFIDEIDAVARKRGTRIQSGSTEQTLNQILVEMDGFEKNTNVIVIAATNRPDVLDRAILRPGRFDRQVRIEAPDKDGRFEILKIHARNKPLDKNVNLETIAKRTVGFTGADLENILNESAIIAAKEGKKEISMEDIDEAVSKVVLGPAKKSRKRTEDELKLVAYHEAGHALVAKFTDKATPVDRISIVSRGSSGGVTMFTPEKDENIVSKTKLMADIKVSLGGRAAEEVALEDISTGASSDIEKATRVARSMVQKFGMSTTGLGMIQYGQPMDSQYLGYHYGDSKDYSEKTAELIDTEVRQIINDSYSQVIELLKDKRHLLDKLANKLLETEVMDKQEFEKIMEE